MTWTAVMVTMKQTAVIVAPIRKNGFNSKDAISEMNLARM